MKYYISYITKNLGWAALMVAFSLTSIVWLTQALRFIDFIVNRGVSVSTFLTLTLLLVPSLLFVILPFAGFVAVLFVYNRLLGDSELVVMQSAGLSRFQLGKPVMVLGIVTTLLAYFLSLYLLPLSYRQFKDMQTFLRDNYASLLLQEEVFNSPVDGLTVFIRQRSSDGTLHGILVHDNTNIEQPVTMMAQRGILQKTATGPRFLLYNGNRQEVKDGRMSYLKFDQYAIDLGFYAKEVTERERKPEELFLPALFREAQERPEVRAEYLAEAHHRIVWPLYNLALSLFAVVLLLTGEFNRRGNWQRIVVAVLVAIVVVATGLSLQNFVTRNLQLVPMLYGNVLGMLVLTFWFLKEHNNQPIPADQAQAAAQ